MCAQERDSMGERERREQQSLVRERELQTERRRSAGEGRDQKHKAAACLFLSDGSQISLSTAAGLLTTSVDRLAQ